MENIDWRWTLISAALFVVVLRLLGRLPWWPNVIGAVLLIVVFNVLRAFVPFNALMLMALIVGPVSAIVWYRRRQRA